MNASIFKKEQRGGGDYGWLKANYYYSFANWYNPKRLGFGSLLVINNDTILPGFGFDFHSHSNMEIITIPISGEVLHEDSIEGKPCIIKEDEIQVISAGTGMYHSEYNNSNINNLELFQIWIKPNKINIKPTYSQKKYDKNKKFQYLISPNSQDTLNINQEVYLSILNLEIGDEFVYEKNDLNLLTSILNINGEVSVEESFNLNKRDILEIVSSDKNIKILSKKKASLIIIEHP